MTAIREQPLELGVAGSFLGGETQVGSSVGTVDHINPATGLVNGAVAMGGAAEIDEAVAEAAAAGPAWRAMSLESRRRILLRIEQLVEEHTEELARLTTLELGHPMIFSLAHPMICASWFGYYAGWVDKLEGATVPLTGLSSGFDYTQREPYGVIGVIITWNGPLVSIGMKVAPALAAGNTVVLKSPELAPFACQRFAELALEAGLPHGVVQVVPGGPEAGERLVRHPAVAKISFTGGLPTARTIMAAAAERVVPVVFELGGKSANLVFPDADIDAAVDLSVGSCFTMAGQGCVLATRLLAHESIYEEVVEKAQVATDGLRVGDPFDPENVVGPVVSEAALHRVISVIDGARSGQGCRIVTGGGAVDRAELPPMNRGGYFVQPTVLADLEPTSEVAVSEVFGPVLSAIPFRDEDEAVRIANGTNYGLGAYLQTRDVGRVQRLVPRLEAGTVSVNGTTALPPGAPFGGYKQSGIGREGGFEGLLEFLQTKNVHISF